MNAYQKQVPIADLIDGMFVCQLPVPWKDTPFPLQGFYVQSQDDKDQLAKYCTYVFIDIVRSRSVNLRRPSVCNQNPEPAEEYKKNIGTTGTKKVIQAKSIKKNSSRYSNTPIKDLDKEFKKAKSTHAKILIAIKEFSENALENKTKALNILRESSASLVESAINNPDALIWLTRLENQRKDLFNHSINAAIWGLILGRHLGLEQDTLQDLTLALLLSKIGLLEDQTSNQEVESPSAYNYINQSLLCLKNSPKINAGVMTTIKTHMERHDGSGGPQAITGDKIPLLGKIAGIADCYEALLNPLDEHQSLSCSEAITFLFSQRDIKFQSDLVEEFIQAIGIYPTGSVVELNNKEIGVVLESRRNTRLQPKLLVVIDEYGQKIKQPKVLNLAESAACLSIKRSVSNSSINISNFTFGNRSSSALKRIFSS